MKRPNHFSTTKKVFKFSFTTNSFSIRLLILFFCKAAKNSRSVIQQDESASQVPDSSHVSDFLVTLLNSLLFYITQKQREKKKILTALKMEVKRLSEELEASQTENAALKRELKEADIKFVQYKNKSEDTITRLRGSYYSFINTTTIPIHSNLYLNQES